jgi:TolA-binding protein
MADICFSTFRPEMAAGSYRLFYERHPQDKRRPIALLRYAQSLEESGRTADAIDIYQKFVIEYPELEEKKEAEQGINRIRLCN